MCRAKQYLDTKESSACNGRTDFNSFPCASQRGNDGFTLLEVVVALAVCALALAVLFAGGAASLRAADIVNRETRAIAVARSQLAALHPTAALRPGSTEGDAPDGLHWRVTVAPAVVTARGNLATLQPLILYDVAVTVTWPGWRGQLRALTLYSRRTAPDTAASARP